MNHSFFSPRWNHLSVHGINIFLLFILFGCGRSDRSQELFGTVSSLSPDVALVQPKEEIFTRRIESFGSLSFTRKTDLTAPTEARVERVFVEEGDLIFNNQLLARLENIQLEIRQDQARAAVVSAESEVRLARTRLEEARRQMEARFLGLGKSELSIEQKALELSQASDLLKNKEELFLIDGISAEELENLRLRVRGLQTEYQALLTDYDISRIGYRDEDLLEVYGYIPQDDKEKRELMIELNTRTAEAELDVALSRLSSSRSEQQSIQKLLEEFEIRAPYRGVLGARHIEEGERVQAGGQLFTTFTQDTVYAIFPVQESQISLLRRGMIAYVTIPSLDSRSYPAEIVQISPTIDPQSGNITIRALLQDPDAEFRPGMFFQVVVESTTPATRLTLPESAIIPTSETNARVFILRNGRVYGRSIQIGERSGGFVVVNSGIDKDDLLVDFPPPILRDGMEVSVVQSF